MPLARKPARGYPDPLPLPDGPEHKKLRNRKVHDRPASPGADPLLDLARMLKPWKPERSAALIARAEKAFDAGSKNMADPEKLYYYVQHYLLTQNEQSHRKISELQHTADSLKYHLFVAPGYSLNDRNFDNPAYIYSYIAAKGIPTDKAIAEHFKSVIREVAEMNIAELEKNAYPVGNPSGKGGWGHTCAAAIRLHSPADVEHLQRTALS